MRGKTAGVLLVVTFAAALLLSVPAMADPVVYTLSAGNEDLTKNKLTGPYATVTLEVKNSKSVQVTVQMQSNYSLWAGKDVFGFNYTGKDPLSITDITSNGNASFTVAQGSNMSEFGRFDYVIEKQNKPGPRKNGQASSIGTTLSFNVSDPNGTLSVQDLLEGTQKKNSYFALHLTNSKGTTGFAGGGTPASPVPEPSSLALLGAGLVTAGGFARRFRNKKDV